MSMKIVKINGIIDILTGLHIGAGNAEVHIGGIDSAVIKNPIDGYPYIPGSSIKGKIRSLLELSYGICPDGKPSSTENTDNIIPKVFGDTSKTNMTRIVFRDCFLSKSSIEKIKSKNILPTEEKSENSIDRLSGTAESPRNIERVIPGLSFDFEMNIRIFDTDSEADFKELITKGLYLLEQDTLGGSGSRGYGKVKFKDLYWGTEELNLEL
ncbi:MAG: type III-A CRISPR-associated RAMP protein Csm3 [Pleomorphochaeta sp.]